VRDCACSIASLCDGGQQTGDKQEAVTAL